MIKSILFILLWAICLAWIQYFPALSAEEATISANVLDFMRTKLFMACGLVFFPLIVLAYLVKLLSAVMRENAWPPHDYSFPYPMLEASHTKVRIVILALILMMTLSVSMHLLNIQRQIEMIEIVADSFPDEE